MAVKISRSFKDISLSFARHPVTNDVTVLKNEDAIKKSVINLCRTRLTERFFNDTLGTSIEGYMFELADDEISGPIEEEVKTLLKNYEQRIELREVVVDANTSENSLNVTVKYYIVGLPFPEQNIQFLLQPTRV
tara:strand:- start:446 stop:847 length:402 start_codon:yes stop_codon:yes gene_type:complete